MPRLLSAERAAWPPTDGVLVWGGDAICPQRPVLDKDTAQTLTRISQAGCGASMIFLAFTIILYTALRWVMPSPLPPVLQGGGSAG